LTKILAGFGQEYFWSQHSSCVPAIKYLEEDNKKMCQNCPLCVRLVASQASSGANIKKNSGSEKKSNPSKLRHDVSVVEQRVE